MFGFGKTSRDPLADVKSTERWLASFPVTDPLAIHGEVLTELGRVAEPTGAPLAAAARSRVLPRRAVHGAAQEPDGAVHRARDAQLEDRAPAVVRAVRPHAGVPRHLLRVRARGVPPRAEPEVAGAAARTPVPADRAHGPRREDPPLPLRAVDPGEVGGAARALLARVLAQVRAAADPARRRGQHHDDRARVPGRAAAAAHERRQHDGAPPGVGGGRAGRVVRAAAPVARAVVGHVVLRRPRRARRPAPPHARAARGPRAVPRHAAAALGADAERRDARAEDPRPAAVGPHAQAHASSWAS